MPLEPPDQQYWQAAVGYVELGMFAEADSELDKIDPFCRALPEVLAVRLAIYRGLKKWELMQQIAKRLKEFEPDNVQWTISLAVARQQQGPNQNECRRRKGKADVLKIWFIVITARLCPKLRSSIFHRRRQ